MPNKDDHVSSATHDRNFWIGIDLGSSPFTDWAISGMFYESVHWVEALLAIKGYHSGNHFDRSRNMRLLKSDLGPIQTDFDILKQDSETARYKCYKHTAKEAKQLIPLVDNIKNRISTLL